MKTNLIRLAAPTVFLMLAAFASVSADTPSTPPSTATPIKIVKAVHSHVSMDNDKNIIHDRGFTRHHHIYPPPSKGGPRMRGESYADVHFDNHSSLYVDCFVDGKNVGTVGPYGDLYIVVPTKAHTLYCATHAEDGGTDKFGPDQIAIGYTGYTYELTE